MASLKKLQLAGVRSFAPSCDEQQGPIISFKPPLTIVVGRNGSGKTTIIEALKYVTTGDTPHGGLGAFIHDPLLSMASTSKTKNGKEKKPSTKMPKTDGIIHLTFVDVNGIETEATGKSTSKGEECNITRMDAASGQLTTLSEKSGVMNTEMANLLGVSKSILNNVIFCHQEDSNWPLGEPKKVKSVFDEIFSADKYTRATDLMKVQIKEKKTARTVAENKVDNAEKLVEQRHARETELQTSETSYTRAHSRITEIQAALTPLDKDHKLMSERLNSCLAIDQELTSAKIKLEQSDATIIRLRQVNLAAVTILRSVEEVDSAKDAINRQLGADIERAINVLKGQRAAMQTEQTTCNGELGKLHAKVEVYDIFPLIFNPQMYTTSIANRDAQIRQMALKHGIATGEGDVGTFVRGLEGVERREQVIVHKATEDHERRLAKLTAEFHAVAANKSHKEQTLTIAGEEETKCATKIDEKRRQLGEIDADCRQLKMWEGKVTTGKTRLDGMRRAFDEEATRRDIAKLVVDLSTVKTSLKSARDEYHSAAEAESSSGTASYLRDELTKRTKEYNSMRRIHVDDIEALGVDARTDDDLLAALNARIDEVQKEIAARCMELANERATAKTSDKERDDLRRTLDDNRRTIADVDEEVLRSTDGVQTVKEKLEELENTLESWRKERDILGGAKKVYERQTHQLVTSSDCPVCATHFQDVDAIDIIRQRMERMIVNIPTDCARLQTMIDRGVVQETELRALNVRVEQTDRLREECATIDTNVNTVTKQWTEAKRALADLTSAQSTAEERAARLHRQTPTMTELSDLHRAITSLQIKVDDHDRKVGAVASTVGRSLGEIKTSIDAHEREEGAMEERKKSKENNMEKYRAEWNAQSAAHDEAKENVFSLTTRMQSTHTLRSTLAEDETTLKRLIDEQPILRQQLSSVCVEFNRAQHAVDACNAKFAEGRATREAAVTAVQQDMRTVDSIIAHIPIITTVNELMPTVKSRLADVERTLDDIATKELNLVEKRSTAEHAQSRLRQLSDNRELLELETRIVELSAVVDVKEGELRHLNVKQLDHDRREINKQMEKLNDKKNQLAGQLQQLKQTISSTRDELRRSTLANAPRDHADAVVTVAMLDAQIGDLAKFIAAIDHGIINYHKEKMSEINAILRILWHDVYVKSNTESNDIEYIEIKTELAQEPGATTKRTQKAYNYRVVMKCADGQTEVDMRARCSAGQKVLASILIRIALAEVFGQNFSMLALDEPTTNLDKDKITALADALGTLVNNRMEHSKFMLLIITHDDNFVEMLERSLGGGFRPRVFRVERSALTSNTIVTNEKR